jgi:hypothetical protein
VLLIVSVEAILKFKFLVISTTLFQSPNLTGPKNPLFDATVPSLSSQKPVLILF